MKTRTLSIILLTSGAGCVVAGMFLISGLGFALLALGVLLIAADFLVPGR